MKTDILSFLEGIIRRSLFLTDLQQRPGQVPAVVDAPVHGDELVDGRLVPHARVVQARVQHDDGEGQHVARVRVGEDVGVEVAVPE